MTQASTTLPWRRSFSVHVEMYSRGSNSRGRRSSFTPCWSRMPGAERPGREKPLRAQRRSRTADKPMIAPSATKTNAKNRRPNARSGVTAIPVVYERAPGRSTRSSYTTNRRMPNPTRPIPLPGLRWRCVIAVVEYAVAYETGFALSAGLAAVTATASGFGRSAGAYRRQESHHHRSYCPIQRKAAPQFGQAYFDWLTGAYARQ